MSHPRFEAMLFERGDLEGRERLALEQHLQECDICQRLASQWLVVEGQLQKAPMAEPAPGFTLRFQERLGLQRRTRRTWTMIGVGIVAAVALLAVAILIGQSLLPIISPGIRYLLKSITSLMIFGGLMQALTDFVGLLIERLVANISPSTLLSYSALFSGMAVIWITTMYKLNFQSSFQEVGK